MSRTGSRLFSQSISALSSALRAVLQGLAVRRARVRALALALALSLALPVQAEVMVMDCDDPPDPAPIVRHVADLPPRAASPGPSHPHHHVRGHRRHHARPAHPGRHCRLKRRCRRTDWAEPGDAPFIGETLGSWAATPEVVLFEGDYRPPQAPIPEPPVDALFVVGGALLALKAARRMQATRRLTPPDRA